MKIGVKEVVLILRFGTLAFRLSLYAFITLFLIVSHRCLEHWISQNNSCPLCKAAVRPRENTPLVHGAGRNQIFNSRVWQMTDSPDICDGSVVEMLHQEESAQQSHCTEQQMAIETVRTSIHSSRRCTVVQQAKLFFLSYLAEKTQGSIFLWQLQSWAAW